MVAAYMDWLINKQTNSFHMTLLSVEGIYEKYAAATRDPVVGSL
jgi:hypothetical protein